MTSVSFNRILVLSVHISCTPELRESTHSRKNTLPHRCHITNIFSIKPFESSQALMETSRVYIWSCPFLLLWPYLALTLPTIQPLTLTLSNLTFFSICHAFPFCLIALLTVFSLPLQLLISPTPHPSLGRSSHDSQHNCEVIG